MVGYTPTYNYEVRDIDRALASTTLYRQPVEYFHSHRFCTVRSTLQSQSTSHHNHFLIYLTASHRNRFTRDTFNSVP